MVKKTRGLFYEDRITFQFTDTCNMTRSVGLKFIINKVSV